MKYVIFLALFLKACTYSKQYEMKLVQCNKVCKPYSVSYVSAKNECVCNLSQLQ